MNRTSFYNFEFKMDVWLNSTVAFTTDCSAVDILLLFVL